MRSLGLLLLNFVVLFDKIDSKAHQKVPTYFARKDKNGQFIDASDPSTWVKINAFPSSSLQTTASLQASPSMVKNGHNVTVSWKGVESSSAHDFIALYCPENAKDNDYIDLFSVQDSPTYKQGSGEYSVQLTNLRTNCQFRYFKYISESHQELIARSNTVMFEGGPEMPLQIHLALTGDPTQMRVMWVSGTGKICDRSSRNSLTLTSSHSVLRMGLIWQLYK